MTYRAALERLFALRRFGMRPGLDGTRAALAALGEPQRGLRTLHVAGTNGKGSTAAFVEAILRAAGRRTGLYTSPHLLRFTERVRVDGAELFTGEVARLAGALFARVPEPTFFEAATAMALRAFRDAEVEVAVVEAGLGGRLDATRAVEPPLVTVVTGVALDHTEVLGETVEAIAREKAGIFRPGVPAVIGCEDEAARAVLLAEAARIGAPVHLRGRDFSAEAPGPLGLAGAHQAGNAALAVRAAELACAALGRPLDEAAVRAGLAGARWPGRLERLADDLVIDAAHNPDGARALAAALPGLAAGRPVHLVFGAVSDKDAGAMLEVLAPVAARVVFTRPESPRAREPETLRALVPSASVEPDPGAAVETARSPGALTVACGSIFLVGAVRRWVTGEPADPLAVQEKL